MANGRITYGVLFAWAVACAAPPVQWRDADSRRADALPGRLLIVGDSALFAPDTLARGTTTPAGACEGSVRVAWSGGSGVERYAAWWAPRPDSSAVLLAARSVDGGRTWGGPEPVDTADQSIVGCARPAPAIAADSASGYVHVAYSMRAPEGTGVFFSHSMEHGHMFHSAVPVVYGDALTPASVAALGDVVAVAYVEPSGKRPALGLALSWTQGHIFEQRVTVPDAGDASDPAVALAPGRVAVAWIQRAPGASPILMTRVGATALGASTRRQSR